MSTSNFAHNRIYNTTIGIAKRFGGAFRIRHPVCLGDARRREDPFGSCPLGLRTDQPGRYFASVETTPDRPGSPRLMLCALGP
jgi:hypothetical protein